MAPVAPMGRERAIETVLAGELPIAIGSPHPNVLICEQDGVFRIRELVVDPRGAEAAMAAARRTRSPSWMPEHYYALGKPTGQIFVEAPTRDELVAVMRAMPWPATW